MSGYGDYSNTGSYSSGYGSDCCPLVVDPLTFISLLSFVALATYFLQQQIEMSMLMMARRKRETFDFIFKG